MQFLAGFILGVVTSVIADFLFRWLEPIVPLSRQKRMMAFFRNPVLYFKLKLNTDERRIKKLIEHLFRAWETKDLNAYASCWTAEAVRTIGAMSTQDENKLQIVETFRSSCHKYSVIKVAALVFDKITLDSQQWTAIVKLHYRFELIRASDGLPIFEESQEFYSLKFLNGSWLIASNIDHYYEIGLRDSR